MTKVSVLMPVYNGEKYLAQAIESIGFQSFTDWELIIIDDGSTDNSRKIAEGYRDNRIYYLKNEGNKGLTYTRNKLIEMASAQYIAFLDCDDMAGLKRLEKQVNFLDTNPDYAMCGTWSRLINGEGKSLKKINLSVSDEEIKCTLLFTSSFVHSSVMIRRNVLQENPYSKDFPLAEDYELWTRLAGRYKFYNLSEPLTKYRFHTTNVSKSKKEELERLVANIHQKELQRIGIEASSEELTMHAAISNIDIADTKTEVYLLQLKEWLKKLHQYASKSKHYDINILKATICFRWIFACKSRKAYASMLSFPVPLKMKTFYVLIRMLVYKIL